MATLARKAAGPPTAHPAAFFGRGDACGVPFRPFFGFSCLGDFGDLGDGLLDLAGDAERRFSK